MVKDLLKVIKRTRGARTLSTPLRVSSFRLFAELEGFSKMETEKILKDLRARGHIIESKRGFIEFI